MAEKLALQESQGNGRTIQLHGLPGAVAWRRAAVDLRAAILVVAQGELRTDPRLDLSQGRKGHVVAIIVPHVELPNVFGFLAVVDFQLEIDLSFAP